MSIARNPSRRTARKAPPPRVPVHAQAHRLWQDGVQHTRQGEWSAAERAFAAAALQAPRDVVMWLNLADARRHLDDDDGALQAAARALECDPDHAVARQLAADALTRRLKVGGPIEQQLQQLPQRLRLDASLLTDVARSLWAVRRVIDAVTVLMTALAASPAHVSAHEMLLYCMRDLGLKSEAAECAKTVLALQPGHLAVRMHLLFDQRGACDWTDLERSCADLVTAVKAADDDLALPLPVFCLLSMEVDPLVQRKAAQIAARYERRGVATSAAPSCTTQRKGPLRVGFLSYDFRDHPVAQLLAETVERLDRRRCRVHLYSHGPGDASAWRLRLQRAADAFVDLADDSDDVIAQRIRDDAVDVLVELGGHTRGSRLGVLARRAAPVQVSWLGYPGTTGLPEVDYLVGDASVTPLDHAADYTEKIAQLHGCLLPATAQRPLPQARARREYGLPDDAFVMCAFNQAYKILPQTFAIWCDVLRAAPNAVLWLKAPNPDAQRNLTAQAQAQGVPLRQLVFAPQTVDYEDHFSRLAAADVFVDNWPYNAHTTASDALWAGLPVLTLRGRTYAARVGASLLHAVGLDDFVCADEKDYRDCLLALTRDPGPLAVARKYLTEQRLNLPVFDSGAFAADLLSLLERMHERFELGLVPDHLPAMPPRRPERSERAAETSAVPPRTTVHVPASEPIRLHVGGKQAKTGWKLLNIQPGPMVDYVGDVCDLSSFPDACAREVYASHVLEHVSQGRMLATLEGLCRILVPGGCLMVSVPDLEVLSHTIISPHAPLEVKFHAMRMMFGGQVDPHDFHCFGWTFGFMQEFLAKAGFSEVRRVESFGLFKDTSDLKPWGFPISLNVIATR